jgi:hypothetical protein
MENGAETHYNLDTKPPFISSGESIADLLEIIRKRRWYRAQDFIAHCRSFRNRIGV